MPAVVEDVLKGLAHRMGHQFVPHQTPVDVEELQIGLATGEGRRRHPAGEAQVDRGLRHRQGMSEEALARQGRQALAQARLAHGRRQVEEDAAIVLKAKPGPDPGQGDAPHHRLDMPQLGLLGTQEFPPGGGVIEKIPDLDSGTRRVSDRLRGVEAITAVAADGPGLVGIGSAGAHLQPRHRGDAGQGLAAEAQGDHRLQLRQAGDLAGGMAAQGQGQVLPGDAAAVVPHP